MTVTSGSQPSGTSSGPVVSVVMAVYNGAEYVGQAIDSILAQTFSDFEFIIIDDGSTDETPAILDCYTDPRIVRLENRLNIGLTRSLNRVLTTARGRYIARQDADDLSMPERLARQVGFLDVHPAVGLVGTAALFVSADLERTDIWQPMTGNPQLQEALVRANYFGVPSVLFRRTCAESIGGWYREDLRYAQDYDLWLRLSEAWDVDNLPETLYWKRIHETMISIAHRKEQDECVSLARQSALDRRLRYGWKWVLGRKAELPSWLKISSRCGVAQRYLWWSAGARGPYRLKYGLPFLLTALWALPCHRTTWRYVLGIAGRKLGI